MADQFLDLSNVINVSIITASAGLALPNINTAAVFTQDVPSWSPTAYKTYTNATDVGTDFGTTSNAFKIAVAFFSQVPNVLNTNGYLTFILLQSAGAEHVEDAILRTLNNVSYFGVLVDQILSGARLAALAAYVQTVDKMLFYASATQADYAPGGMLDLIRSTASVQTRCLYYHTGTAIDTQRMAAAYAGRALTTNFSGSNTTQTMHLKTLVGIVPDATVDQTQLNALQLAGVDCYVNCPSGQPGAFTAGANAFFDDIYNEFWFKFAIQTAIFNLLKQTSTKLPQTEGGLDALKNACRLVCDQAVRNRFAGPGAWTSPDSFGDPEALIRGVKDYGYYVYTIPIAQQSASDRSARKAPPIQIALKTQGAIHRSSVIVNVNQ